MHDDSVHHVGAKTMITRTFRSTEPDALVTSVGLMDSMFERGRYLVTICARGVEHEIEGNWSESDALAIASMLLGRDVEKEP